MFSSFHLSLELLDQAQHMGSYFQGLGPSGVILQLALVGSHTLVGR